MHYDRITRMLHASLAFGILLQVIASTLMTVPRPGRAENVWWEIHQNLGLILGVVLVVHWLWTLRRSVARGEAYMLFPWFSAKKLGLLIDDLRDTLDSVRHGRLPEPDQPRPLPAALQSVGLILATYLSFSGAIALLYIGTSRQTWPTSIGLLLDVHEIAGNLMWAYLVVHPLIAVVHELAGQPLVRRMFNFAPNAVDEQR